MLKPHALLLSAAMILVAGGLPVVPSAVAAQAVEVASEGGKALKNGVSRKKHRKIPVKRNKRTGTTKTGAAMVAAGVLSDAELLNRLPQNMGLEPWPQRIIGESEALRGGRVDVQLGLKEQNPQWEMSQTALQVLPGRLQAVVSDSLPDARTGAEQDLDRLLTGLPNAEPNYRGLVLRLTRSDGKPYAPMLVHGGKLMTLSQSGAVTLGMDPGRRLEYWLFGTARIRRDLMLASQVLPVATFEQCRVLGNMVVDTQPRQCLLPDQNILLETPEPLTKAGLAAKDFSSCLQHGQALIYTFPRRCLAAGGRVFTEPPQVYEAVSSTVPGEQKGRPALPTTRLMPLGSVSGTLPGELMQGVLVSGSGVPVSGSAGMGGGVTAGGLTGVGTTVSGSLPHADERSRSGLLPSLTGRATSPTVR